MASSLIMPSGHLKTCVSSQNQDNLPESSGQWALDYRRSTSEDTENNLISQNSQPRLVRLDRLDHSLVTTSYERILAFSATFNDSSISSVIDDDERTVIHTIFGGYSQTRTSSNPELRLSDDSDPPSKQSVKNDPESPLEDNPLDTWSDTTLHQSLTSSQAYHISRKRLHSDTHPLASLVVKKRRLRSNRCSIHQQWKDFLAAIREPCLASSDDKSKSQGKVMQFPRQNGPSKPDPALHESAPSTDSKCFEPRSRSIQGYRIFLHLTCDLRLSCNMTFHQDDDDHGSDLYVYSSNWDFTYCLVNGHSTSALTPLRTNKDGSFEIFRLPCINGLKGTQIELHWEMSWKDLEVFWLDMEGLTLPGIMSHEVSRGRVDCSVHQATLVLEDQAIGKSSWISTGPVTTLPVVRPTSRLRLMIPDPEKEMFQSVNGPTHHPMPMVRLDFGNKFAKLEDPASIYGAEIPDDPSVRLSKSIFKVHESDNTYMERRWRLPSVRMIITFGIMLLLSVSLNVGCSSSYQDVCRALRGTSIHAPLCKIATEETSTMGALKDIFGGSAKDSREGFCQDTSQQSIITPSPDRNAVKRRFEEQRRTESVEEKPSLRRRIDRTIGWAWLAD